MGVERVMYWTQTRRVCTEAQWLNCWAVDRPDMQYAVRVCSKSMLSQRVNDWQRLERVARYVNGCPDTGSCSSGKQHTKKTGDRSTRKSVSAGNSRCGQHLFCSWSKDWTVMGTENMARELGVHLDAMELQVDANAAIGIIGRQGLETRVGSNSTCTFINIHIYVA